MDIWDGWNPDLWFFPLESLRGSLSFVMAGHRAQIILTPRSTAFLLLLIVAALWHNEGVN